MKTLALITVLFAATGVNAQESTFQETFVNRTILGNWTPGVNAVSNDTPNVDASLVEFAASIWGSYPRLTEEQNSQGNATADQFTRQFK